MANSEVSALGLITAAKLNELTRGTTAPTGSNLVSGAVWVDTTQDRPEILYRRTNANGWITTPNVMIGMHTGAQTVTGTNQDVTNGGSYDLYPLVGTGAKYQMELEFAVTAGGATFKDLELYFRLASGSGTMTLGSGRGIAISDLLTTNVDAAVSAGNPLVITNSTRIGQAGQHAWFRGVYFFTVSAAGTWDFDTSRNGAEASDPIINKFFCRITRGAQLM